MRIGIALVLVSAVASADPQDPDHKRADALFEEGKALIDSGKLEEGCAKLEESLALDRNAIGTILNVAKCQARLGKIATAVATYTDVRERAKLQNQPEYGKVADDSIAQLEPFVPHLAITVADKVDGLEVTLDDKPLKPETLSDLPVDPGAHTIAATAPGRRPYSERITIAKKERKEVAIPALAGFSKPFPVGMTVTIAGGGLAVTGVVLGLIARSQYNSALSEHCHGDATMCDDGGTAANSARTLGNVGTVIGVVGLAAAGVGTYL